MIENTLERIANALERIAGLQQLPNGLVASPAVELEYSNVEPPKPTRARKAKAVEAEEAPATPAAVQAETITPDAIAAELRLFVTKFGTQKAKDLLTRFGANRVSEIKPEDFVPVMDALKSALKAK